MAESETVHLVAHETTQHHNHQRVSPQFVSQQFNIQHQLNDAVRQKVERCEVPTLSRIAFCHPKKVIGDEIVGIFGQFGCDDGPNNSVYGLWRNLEE